MADLPDEFGKWNRVLHTFRPMGQEGCLASISTRWSKPRTFEHLIIYATIVRAASTPAGGKRGAKIRDRACRAAARPLSSRERGWARPIPFAYPTSGNVNDIVQPRSYHGLSFDKLLAVQGL